MVGLFAVQHAQDLQVIPLLAEEHAVVLSAEPDERRLYVTKLLRITLTGVSKASQRFENPQRSGLLDTPNIGYARSRRRV